MLFLALISFEAFATTKQLHTLAFSQVDVVFQLLLYYAMQKMDR